MKKQLYLILSLLITSCNSVDDIDVIENGDLFSTESRVVGYYSTGSFSLNDKIQYCKLTHLNIAFANPQIDGTMVLPGNSGDLLKNVMDTARSQNSNIKIYIAIGGGWLSDEMWNTYKNFLANPQDRPILIDKIVSYVLDNGFDGVDVDLEWKYVTTGYSDFVIELSDALKAQSKGITAAYPSETRYSLINDEALNALDFINLMVYDYTGPWNPSPGQHSSYNHAKRGIHFWKNKVGINPSKLTLGVPFYGYDFQNSTTVKSFTYGSMVDSDVSNSEKDNVGKKYYNGRPTIANKVNLASQNLSGIMIWRIGADSFSEYSLLETIHKTYTDLGVETTGLCGN
jgi:GH18 family chitinase